MTEIDQVIEHGGCPGAFGGAGNDMSMHLSQADFVRIQKDTPIYRYMGLEEFHCLMNGSLRLTCPFKWVEADGGDRWENVLFQTKIYRDEKQIDTETDGRKTYVHCWTHVPESDAMWRLYGNDYGVKIRTTAEKLLAAANNAIPLGKNLSILFKIGKVAYLPEKQIKAFFSEKHRVVDNIRCHHESMMIKRDFYTHENEVRLVAYDFDDRNRLAEKERHNLKFSPEEPNHLDIQIGAGTAGEWIDELVIDPRLSDFWKRVVRDLVLKTKFDENRIKESSLLPKPEIVIRLE
jgi:hypothetical protein